MDLEDLPRCLEPECGTYLGWVHMVAVCRECADRAGVTIAPIPGDPRRDKLS